MTCTHKNYKVDLESMSSDEYITTLFIDCTDCQNNGYLCIDMGTLGQDENMLEYHWHTDECRDMITSDPATQYCRCEVGD